LEAALNETPKQYTARMLSLAGSSDPLKIMAATPAKLQRLVDGCSAATLRRRPASGKWSVRQIVAHLADTEVVFAYRTRMILSRSGTEIQAFDQDVWASEGQYEDVDVKAALAAFSSLRKLNLAFVRRLSPEKRSRFGIHQERGKESIDHLMRMYAGHDLNHLGQIAAILRDSL
jgi:uncharacterized damage-inducible protein DinB